MAEFLIALADFDRRRGWEALGHASLFAFLVAELKLSKSAAYYRRSAAELLQHFPEVVEPLREGQLCLSTVGELAKVLTEANRAVVTPRFFGLSSREAQELVAELQPRPVPSTRMVVTRLFDQSAPPPARAAQTPLTLTLPSGSAPATTQPFGSRPPSGAHPDEAPPWRFPTSGIANGGGADGRLGRLVAKRDEIEPLTADVRRVHFNVDKQVVRKLAAAREGLSHTIRGATMEQVLEAALDLLLEKQARARGQVKRPRGVATTAAAGVEKEVVATETQRSIEHAPGIKPKRPPEAQPSFAHHPTEPPSADPLITEPRPPRRTGPREPIPAAVRRAVWARDSGCCSWPLDGGGRCGSTHRLELDHLVPWARWGDSTEANLRLTCAAHNRLAARKLFGERVVRRYANRAEAR
jgi:hypothetical protein